MVTLASRTWMGHAGTNEVVTEPPSRCFSWRGLFFANGLLYAMPTMPSLFPLVRIFRDDVGTINHPPVITIDSWYLHHSQMGDLLLLYVQQFGMFGGNRGLASPWHQWCFDLCLHALFVYSWDFANHQTVSTLEILPLMELLQGFRRYCTTLAILSR